MELSSSEILEPTYDVTLCDLPEKCNLHTHFSENARYYFLLFLFFKLQIASERLIKKRKNQILNL
jgi:hypothetical protein